MADPIPQAEPQFKVAEVIHYGGETTVTGLSPEMQGYKDRAAQLRKEKADLKNDGKSFLDSLRNKSSEKSLTSQNREDLTLRFGAGEAKRNASGNIEAPTIPEAKALYDEAQAEIKNINGFIQYLEITAEAKKTGKSIPTILGERSAKRIAGPGSQTEFDVQKKQVLDYVINTEVIQKGFPELTAITNPDDRRKLIEETLGADPALRAKIVEKMVSIAERAKALPEPPVSKEVKEAEDSKKSADVKITENLDLVRDRLKDLGIDDTRADALRKDVEKYLKDGKSLDQVLGYLRSESSNQLLKNIPVLQEYINASNLVEGLQSKLEGFDTRKTDQAVIADVRARMQNAQEIVDKFQADSALVAELDSYQNIIRTFTAQKDSSSSVAEGGIFLSPVANGIDQIIKSQKTILNADKVISEKGEQSKKDQEAWRTNRMVEESNLISEIKNILPTSIAEVLSDRYDEMVGLEKQRMARVAEEESKKGNEAIANGIKKVEEAKGKNWIEYDRNSRKKEVHRYNLGTDIKYAAYAGEDGIKRLILRDSGIQLKDATGNPLMTDADGWKYIDLSNLSEDSRKTLDGIYDKQKDSYRQKLFGDFFLGKNFFNRRFFGIQFGELALKKHEYELLQTKFGESFMQRINSKAEAKAVMEKLKASGIKPTGGLLFALLAALALPYLATKKVLEG